MRLSLERAAVAGLYSTIPSKVYAGDTYGRPRPNQVRRRRKQNIENKPAEIQFEDGPHLVVP
jgi:hypothetical protein